jgi:hypothetical protein
MMVILKIPIIALLWIVWWAVRQEPEPADEERRDRIRRPPHHPRRPRHPRPPRRGPHAEPPPATPKRIRAHGRRVQRAHG